ncbi:MAG: 2Fe-2S iron-sulfur cluster-binding protein [Alphaproteobacteria bacterium]
MTDDIIVTDRNGNTQGLEALEGWRVMEIIRDHGLPIEGLCGGACSCATCHVYIDENWLQQLPPMEAEEQHMLQDSFHYRENSRLSCQIIWSEKLKGLTLTLAPEE